MDFNDALNTKGTEVEKPPVLPQGNYIWAVTKVPTKTRTKSGEWDIIEFPIRAIAAEDDVDPDELEQFGSLGSAMNRVSFLFPTDTDKAADVKKALYRLTQFLQNTLRVEAADDATILEMLDLSINCQFLGTASWRPSDDGEDTYIDVKNLAPID